MKKKSNKKKVKKIKSRIYLLIGITIFFIFLLLIFLCIRVFSKDYYKVESRLDNVKNAEKFEDSGYETVGWLKIQGTDIDNSVVFSSDYYEEFPMQLENFVWLNDEDAKFHNMIKISGHNLFNLSSSPRISSSNFHRFEQLMAFVYYDFAKENKYIQLTLDGEEYVYKIFFAGFVPNYELSAFQVAEGDFSKKELKNWFKIIDKYNLYDYDIDVNENDNIVSLSTCTRFFGQKEEYSFYVNGRLLRVNEKINNYKVKKNKKSYKKVEDVLKGDENNEESSL